jgi:hypothetical protein
MRYENILLTFSAILAGCSATLPVKNPEILQLNEITLSSLEKLHFNQDNSGRIESIFGVPNKIVTISNTQNLWVYNDKDGQRATFVVDSKSGVVLSGTLLLKNSDPLHDLKYALTYFESSKFSIKGEGWIANHELSSDVSYIDPNSGVSLAVNQSTKTVSMIGLSELSRTPAGLAKIR